MRMLTGLGYHDILTAVIRQQCWVRPLGDAFFDAGFVMLDILRPESE